MTYSSRWLMHFRRHALAAADSVKEATKIGACLIGRNNEVLLTAFNGPAIGVKDTAKIRVERPLKYMYSSHAERNVINFAARNGIRTEGLTLYTTHASCCDCADAIIQAGIQCVIVGTDDEVNTTSMSDESYSIARKKFNESGVKLIYHRVSPFVEQAEHLARALLVGKTITPRETDFYHVERVNQSTSTIYAIGDDTRAAIYLYTCTPDQLALIFDKDEIDKVNQLRKAVKFVQEYIEVNIAELDKEMWLSCDLDVQLASLHIIKDLYREDHLLLRDNRRILAQRARAATLSLHSLLPRPYCFQQGFTVNIPDVHLL